MELHDIYDLLERFEDSTLERLHVKLGGNEFSASRSGGEWAAIPESPLPVKPAPRKAPAPDAVPTAAPLASDTKDGAETDHHKVTSPIVGTFYTKPSEDAAPFVAVGDAVKAGDVLCIIEAMKIMNEIKSPVSGTIERVLAKDGEMLDFGKVLFHIKEDGHA